MQFLGYIISAKCIRIEIDHIKAIRSWREPHNIRDIQVFIDFANFYRCFIYRFSKKAAALTLLIINPFKKCVKKSITSFADFLTEKAKRFFNIIKDLFIEAFILQYFDHTLLAQVETNASSRAIRRIFTQ